MDNQDDVDSLIEQSYERNKPKNCLFDNMMMNEAFKGNISLLRHFLTVITEKQYQIDTVSTQKRIGLDEKNGYIVLDIEATDDSGSLFDIEFQNVITDNQLSMRLRRYFSTMIYTDYIEQKKKWKEENERKPEEERVPFKEVVHKKCIIFFVNQEGMGSDFKVFDQSTLIGEKKREGVIHYFPNIPFDEYYVIYMKGVKEETELGSLIHDILCRNADEIHNKMIANVVHSLQEGDEEDMASKKTQIDFHRAVRAEVYDAALKRGKAEGIAQGRAEDKAEIAENLISMGFDTPIIHKATGLSESEIEDLRKA